MRYRSRITHMAAIVALGVAFPPGRGSRPPLPYQYQYAAKVVCGPLREGYPLASQSYATTININNPSDSLIAFFRKWLVLTFPPGMQQAQPPLRPMNDSLPMTYALMTDCRDMARRNRIAQPFFEGFLVIQSTLPLDVIGVYTVPGGVDVVPATERRIYVVK